MNTSQLRMAVFVVWASFLKVGPDVLAQAEPPAVVAPVTFVGCESDGQVGPLQAPKNTLKTPVVPVEFAVRLAYYQAEEGFGVLAPRGWYCFSTYGSNGSTLYVAPEPIDSKTLFSDNWKGFSGQVIQVSNSVGDTSGRFEVATAIARVFPSYKKFVQDVIAEKIVPASSFPMGPYPTDKLTYRGKKVVEFETPSNATGLGTDSRLRVNSSPIRGVAILFGEEPSLLKADLRLSTHDEDLIHTIVGQIEKEAAAVDRQSYQDEHPSLLR